MGLTCCVIQQVGPAKVKQHEHTKMGKRTCAHVECSRTGYRNEHAQTS